MSYLNFPAAPDILESSDLHLAFISLSSIVIGLNCGVQTYTTSADVGPVVRCIGFFVALTLIIPGVYMFGKSCVGLWTTPASEVTKRNVGDTQDPPPHPHVD